MKKKITVKFPKGKTTIKRTVYTGYYGKDTKNEYVIFRGKKYGIFKRGKTRVIYPNQGKFPKWKD